MSSKRIVGMAVLVLAAAAAWSAVEERPASERPARLVRLDLLRTGEPKLLPERRNIFAEGRGEPEAVVPPVRGRRPGPGASGPGAAEPSAPQPDIRYIGWVVSPRGIIGLVLVDGSAQSLTAGEAFRPGYAVSRLTRAELDITGPGGVVKTYSLQGEDE